MTKAELERLLKKKGYKVRQGTKHSVWIKKGCPRITVQRGSGDISKYTLKAIFKIINK